MARIRDIFTAIISTGEGFDDIVRILAAAGQGAEPLLPHAFADELHWITDETDRRALDAMREQKVAYHRIVLKRGGSGAGEARLSPNVVALRVRLLLEELQKRDELHYPFTLIAKDTILLLSVVDFSILMALAREQQLQKSEPENVKDSRLFARTAPLSEP